MYVFIYIITMIIATAGLVIMWNNTSPQLFLGIFLFVIAAMMQAINESNNK